MVKKYGRILWLLAPLAAIAGCATVQLGIKVRVVAHLATMFEGVYRHRSNRAVHSGSVALTAHSSTVK